MREINVALGQFSDRSPAKGAKRVPAAREPDVFARLGVRKIQLVTLGYRQANIYSGTAPGSLVGDYPAALQEPYSLFSSLWGLRRTVEAASSSEAGSIGPIRLAPFGRRVHAILISVNKRLARAKCPRTLATGGHFLTLCFRARLLLISFNR